MPRRLTEEEDALFDAGAMDTPEDVISQADVGLAQVSIEEKDYLALFYDILRIADKTTETLVKDGRRIYRFLHVEECQKCHTHLQGDIRCPECQALTPEKMLEDGIFWTQRAVQFVGRLIRGAHNWDVSRRWINRGMDNALGMVSGRVSREKVVRFTKLYRKWKPEWGMPNLGVVIIERGAEAADREFLEEKARESAIYLDQNFPLSDEDITKANEMCFLQLVDELEAARSPFDELFALQRPADLPWSGRDKARARRRKQLRLER